MSYIGQGLPADTFQGFVTDSFTGDGSATTFTLSKEPFSEDTLIVVINNVIQKPTTNFTVSGTTLTIVGTAVADGDVIYAIHMGGPLPIGGAAELDLNGASDKLVLDADGDTTISADTDDQIDFKAGGTDTMHIINGKVGIGTSSPGSVLQIDGASTPKLTIKTADGTSASVKLQRQDENDIYTDFELKNDGGVFKIISDNASINERALVNFESAMVTFNEDSADVDFRVETNGAAYALFVDGGNDVVMFGGTGSGSSTSTARSVMYSSGHIYQFVATNSTTDIQRFYNADTGSEIGSIEGASSSTAFRTSSDYRLKENVDYDWDATTRLKQLKPARFNWIVDDTNTPVDGFLAHEVSSVVPEAVGGEKDAVDDDGKIIPQGIDQSKLVPLMVKTIQELEARIKTLEDA
jgi:hypothetical protein